MTKEKVIVKINGAEYTLRGDGTEAYLYSIAKYVDKKLKDVLSSNPRHSNTSAAVLTALTLADEYFRTKEVLENAEKEIRIPKEREASLKAQYDKLREAYEGLNNEYEGYRNDVLEVSSSMKDLEDDNKRLNNELDLKIKELKYLQEQINKLKLDLKESEEINKVLIKKNETIKAQAVESLIEATTLKKEIKEFKDARLKNKTM